MRNTSSLHLDELEELYGPGSGTVETQPSNKNPEAQDFSAQMTEEIVTLESVSEIFADAYEDAFSNGYEKSKGQIQALAIREMSLANEHTDISVASVVAYFGTTPATIAMEDDSEANLEPQEGEAPQSRRARFVNKVKSQGARLYHAAKAGVGNFIQWFTTVIGLAVIADKAFTRIEKLAQEQKDALNAAKAEATAVDGVKVVAVDVSQIAPAFEQYVKLEAAIKKVHDTVGDDKSVEELIDTIFAPFKDVVEADGGVAGPYAELANLKEMISPKNKKEYVGAEGVGELITALSTIESKAGALKGYDFNATLKAVKAKLKTVGKANSDATPEEKTKATEMAKASKHALQGLKMYVKIMKDAVRTLASASDDVFKAAKKATKQMGAKNAKTTTATEAFGHIVDELAELAFEDADEMLDLGMDPYFESFMPEVFHDLDQVEYEIVAQQCAYEATNNMAMFDFTVAVEDAGLDITDPNITKQIMDKNYSHIARYEEIYKMAFEAEEKKPLIKKAVGVTKDFFKTIWKWIKSIVAAGINGLVGVGARINAVRKKLQEGAKSGITAMISVPKGFFDATIDKLKNLVTFKKTVDSEKTSSNNEGFWKKTKDKTVDIFNVSVDKAQEKASMAYNAACKFIDGRLAQIQGLLNRSKSKATAAQESLEVEFEFLTNYSGVQYDIANEAEGAETAEGSVNKNEVSRIRKMANWVARTLKRAFNFVKVNMILACLKITLPVVKLVDKVKGKKEVTEEEAKEVTISVEENLNTTLEELKKKAQEIQPEVYGKPE